MTRGSHPGAGLKRVAQLPACIGPAAGSTAAIGSMVTPYGRFGHAALLLRDGKRVLVVGGKKADAGDAYFRDAHLHTP